MTTYVFHVVGLPKPQGSKRHVGNGVMIESAGQPLKTWREDVKHAAIAARNGQPPLTGPLRLAVTFLLPRPSSHMRTGRNAHLLRDAAPTYPHRKPDLDKLLRSTCDAITTAGLWLDDSCVVSIVATKDYCTSEHPTPGALIGVQTIPDEGDEQ